MRQRLSTIWLLLALLPYVSLTLGGAFLHHHRRAHVDTPCAQSCSPSPSGTAVSGITGGDQDEDCSLCRWTAGIAGGALPAVAAAAPLASPPGCLPRDSAYLPAVPATLAALRAPPACL